MKKLLLILLCLPMIGFGQNKILAKYNGTNALMGQFYEMNLLLCGNYHSDNLKDYKWKNISNWTKQGSKILRLSYYADINYDEDEIEYYTISKEVKKFNNRGYLLIEIEFKSDLNNIFLNEGLLDHSASFISAKKQQKKK